MNRPRITGRALAALALPIVLLAPTPAAQAPATADSNAAFEVASVRRNTTNPAGAMLMGAGIQPGGRVTYSNLTLRTLIVRAFEVQPYQVIGGPRWIDTDRFDIVAKAEGDVTPADVNRMMRSLLIERFRLVVRSETRELPLYNLVLARRDGRLGPQLHESTADCAAGAAGRGTGAAPDRVITPGTVPRTLAGCRTLMAPGRIQMSGQSMSQLAQLLSNQVGRPVTDQTGLTGRYDLELSFLPEGRGGFGAGGGLQPPGATGPGPDPDAPALVTAIQEQLGLRLVSARGPVDVLVVASVEPPVED